jgi:hypothetical protein
MIAENPIAAGAVLLAACVVAVLITWHLIKVGTPVERWAKTNGFKLISEEREVSASVRIMGIPRQMMQIYRIVVRDGEGRTRRGRLEWTGDPLDKMHVRWDD